MGRSATKQRDQQALSRGAEAVLRRRLRRHCCSEAWVDAQIISSLFENERGQIMHRRYFDPSVFPPGGEQTRMLRCPKCGVWTPPVAFEAGICLDHSEAGSWGPSPSAQAILVIRGRKVRPQELHLEPESVRALTREIAKFQERTRKMRKKKNRRLERAGGEPLRGSPPV